MIIKRFLLKGPQRLRTHPLWDSAPATAGRAQVAYGEKGRK